MKKYLILTIGIIAIACQTFAQRLDVSLTLANTAFIIGEPVLVQVKLINTLREPLEFGTKDKLFIEITRANQLQELVPYNDEPFIKPLVLNPGNTLDHRLEIDKWFSLHDSGKYLVRAVIVHGDMRYESARKSFDVIPGITLREGVQMFTNRQRLQRNFKLVYWMRNQTNRLFLRIEDEPEGQVWDTIDLGTYLKDSEAKLDIAPNGEVTVIHRSTRDSFLRVVIWSLPDSVEIAEHNALIDPEVSASQRVRSLYGDLQGETEKKQSTAWWEFWK
jgi:hypothetical protein